MNGNPDQTAKAAPIVIADDSDSVRAALATLLTRAGYTVVAVQDGMQVLETLATEDCTLLVLDARMPGLDGYQTAAILRARAATRDLPILILTGETGSHERAMSELAGADRLLGKSADGSALISAVRALLGDGQRRERRTTTTTDMVAD
ncbi:MAG: hypothetical protein CSB44_11635 [Gammaproteobacteria bacterium]|nr:MAG: hypothetical protein CSB44_11635 [Gammaproteobacteria bacterium]